ncbi:MAG TPA: NAD(P)/FAD-dependent oxidoreductase [Synergistaceae bacterium]|nr:NAD(P)/FAD-dependent oxidoreductase [Synergistaceae bacterium]
MNVAVIGAGATGLTAALELVKAGYAVTLFETHPVPGGMARTCMVGEEPLEIFYHHIFTSDSAVPELARELELEKNLRWMPPKNALYAGKKLHPFTSPGDLLRFSELSLLDRLRMGLFVLRTQKRSSYEGLEHLTAREWVLRETGPKIFAICWEPLLHSKFGSSAGEVSATWLWNKIKLRSSSRGKGQKEELLGYLEGSFGTLYSRALEELQRREGITCMGTEIGEIRSQGKGVRITTSRGHSALFDKILYTGSPRQLADLCPDLSKEEKKRYRSIQSMANLCLMLEMEKPLSEYYWISIADKGLPFVAVIEHTNLIPRERYGCNVLYLSRYLSPEHSLFKAPDDEVRDLFLQGLEKIFPSWNPENLRDFRLFRCTDTQPVVDRKYPEKIPPHRTSVSGLYLACMDQIFPEDRGQNYAIAMGRKALKILDLDLKDRRA